MNLLCERKQSSATFTLVPLQFGGGVMFTLWAKAEFEELEYELLQKYHFENALLIADDWTVTLRKSLKTSIWLGVVLWFVLFTFLSWSTSTTLTFFAILAFTAIYFNELREHIYVRDLVYGRTFRCFSIVELIHKEEYLKGLTMYLRQVLESAKHWGGREVVEIPTLSPNEARQLILKAG